MGLVPPRHPQRVRNSSQMRADECRTVAMHRSSAWLSLLLALFFRAAAGGAGIDYWVWHRTTPLSVAERAELAAQEVQTLFWNVGEMENRAGAWRWKTPPRALTGVA